MRTLFSLSLLLLSTMASARLTNPSLNQNDTWCTGARGVEDCVDKNGNFLPTTDNIETLGTSALRWASIYGINLTAVGGNVGIGSLSPTQLLSIHTALNHNWKFSDRPLGTGLTALTDTDAGFAAGEIDANPLILNLNSGAGVGVGVSPCSTCIFQTVGGVSLGHTVMSNFQVAFTTAGVCSQSTCALTASTPGISSITRSLLGRYSVNFAAGTFSTIPACSVFSMGYGAAINFCVGSGLQTTTTLTFECANVSGADVDASFNVICIGP